MTSTFFIKISRFQPLFTKRSFVDRIGDSTTGSELVFKFLKRNIGSNEDVDYIGMTKDPLARDFSKSSSCHGRRGLSMPFDGGPPSSKESPIRQ